MKLNNQKPQNLKMGYIHDPTTDFDPVTEIQEDIIHPIFIPLGSTPVTLTDTAGNNITADDITTTLLKTLGDTVDSDAEDETLSVMHQAYLNIPSKTTLLIDNLMVINNLRANSLKDPSPGNVIYHADDIINESKAILAGAGDPTRLMACIAGMNRPKTLGVYGLNEDAFNDFFDSLDLTIQALSPHMDQDVIDQFRDLRQLDYSQLVDGIVLRNTSDSSDPSMAPYSFARILMHALTEYTSRVTNPSTFGLMEFSLIERYIPKTIIFINIEAHARATRTELNRAWDIVNRSLKAKVKLLKKGAINKLTTVARNQQRIQANLKQAQNAQQAQKAARLRFRKEAPPPLAIAKLIHRVLKKMINVSRSQNSIKEIKLSFARPNRRDPDDFNRKGRIISTKYKPDIHIYLDTSGSISEANYQDTIKTLISMAKRLDVNLYFSSFSHFLSRPTMLQLKGKSTPNIYREFQKIDKVTGGTNFANVWHFINASPVRKKRLNILITDFEWHASQEYIEHPKNLYYIPIAEQPNAWPYRTRAAKSFIKSATHNDPNIASKVLGIFE